MRRAQIGLSFIALCVLAAVACTSQVTPQAARRAHRSPASAAATSTSAAPASVETTSTTPVTVAPGAGTPDGSAPDTTAPDSTTPGTTAPSHHLDPTTTMPMGPMPSHAGVDLSRFRNSNGLYNRFANVPASQLNPRSLLVDGRPDPQWFASNAANPPTGVNGQFRTRCEFSHLAYDDPIVKPGQPGAAHLHMFFGNTGTDAFSTAASVTNSGGSTCDGFELNRTSYWFPALLDAAGGVRIPNNMMLYYKGEGVTPPPGGYSDMPPGLKMIGGNPKATSPQPSVYNFGWACGNMFTTPRQTLIPSNCTTKLMMKMTFPRCWNGRTDFDSPDALSFVVEPSGGTAGGTCPADHPKVFPEVMALFDWDLTGNTAGWHLSSDMTATGQQLPGGTTMHGDWFGGWNPAIMHNWMSGCVTAEWNCQTSFIGRNNLVAGAPGTVNQLAPTPLVYMDKGPVVFRL